MSGVKNALLREVSAPVQQSSQKVTVVGAGQVGAACIFTLLAKNITNNVVLINRTEGKAKGEVMDLQHGSLFLKNPKIVGSSDYADSAGSKLCIVTTGVRKDPTEQRLNLLKANAAIFKTVIPPLVKYSPNTILLIVSNPVDILTYVAGKLSGLPKHRVIGSGTNLDTSRFRFLLSQKLEVSPNSCHGWIIGEHGDSSVPVWSSVNVAGVRLRSLNPKIGTEEDPEKWGELHTQVMRAAWDVARLKGSTSWAVALNVAELAQSILNNTHNVYAVSIFVKGHQGIEEDVCLSLPAALGQNGVSHVVEQDLTEFEHNCLLKSATVMYEAQSVLDL